MEEKPINIVISENLDSVEKLGTGRYRITFNESLDPSWNEVALTKLSLPISEDYYNLTDSTVFFFSFIGIHASVFTYLSAGKYTIEHLTHIINTDLVRMLKENNLPEVADYFKIEIDNKLTKITLDNEKINAGGSFQFPTYLAKDLLGFDQGDDILVYNDLVRFYFNKNTKHEYISKKSPALYLKQGLLMVNASWIPPQVSNFKLKENIMEVVNLVHAAANQEVYVENTTLNWFPLDRSSKKTIDISFSDGLNYINISANQVVFIQLLVRKKNTNI